MDLGPTRHGRAFVHLFGLSLVLISEAIISFVDVFFLYFGVVFIEDSFFCFLFPVKK